MSGRSSPRFSRAKQKEAPSPADRRTRLWRIHPDRPPNPEKAYWALGERVKELNCLYGVAQLGERYADSMEDFLGELVEFLPLSWQYPEVTCARVVLGGRTYRSGNFRLTQWRQAAAILVHGDDAGEVAIFYLDERPAAHEGPFLAEERVMLEEVAKRIAAMAVRLEAERELQEVNRQLTVERTALQESNAALRAVLARIEEEKQQLCRDVQENIQRIILPVLHALSLELPPAKRAYAEILRNNLEEIAAPFASRLSREHQGLSPAEVAICNLIKSGLSSKEIAQLRGVTVSTVHRQREHIRRKLNLQHETVNLSTFLRSFGAPGA